MIDVSMLALCVVFPLALLLALAFFTLARGGRVFAASFAMALLAVLSCVLLIFAPSAKAQSVYPDQGAAYAACQESLAIAGSWAGATPKGCDLVEWGSYYHCSVMASGSEWTCTYWNGNTRTDFPFPPESTCSTRPEEFNWGPVQGNAACYQGCTYTKWVDPSSPTGLSYVPSGSVCTTAEHPEPKPDTDGDGVPDDEDAFPNDPNESADSDGDGIGDNGDTAPDDPTNGEDEGEGNETDNSAQGGGDCQTPPVCKGDGIACNTNFQIWKARCAVERQGGEVTGSPGNCNAGYTCTGNAVGCAQLAVQRQAMCATGGGTGPGGEPGSVSGTGDCGQPYVCTGDAIACAALREQQRLRCSIDDGNGDDDYGESRDPDDYVGISDSPFDIGELDSQGFLSGRQCPLLQVDLIQQIPGNVGVGTCNVLAALAMCIMLYGYWKAARIIGGALTGGGE